MSNSLYKLFSSHPKVDYEEFSIRDITRQARILIEIRESDRYAADYYIQDHETPTSLAQDLYGDPNLFWILLNLNNIIDPWHDWPLNHWELVQYTRQKYNLDDEGRTMFWGSDNIWYREYELENAVLNTEWANSVSQFKANADLLSYFDYESMENDKKRYIRVVRPEHIDDIINEYRKEISS